MIEIKFKGLTTKGEWIYGSLVNTTAWIKHLPKQHTKTWIIESSFGNGGWFNILRKQYVLPATVGQFTGQLDKNGNEIYHGDMLRLINWNEPAEDCPLDEVRTVSFRDGCFTVKNIEDESYCNIDMVEPSLCEIVGNINNSKKRSINKSRKL